MANVEIAVKGLLDKLPPAVRHAVLLFAGSLLTWAAGAAAGVEVPGNAFATGIVLSAATSIVGTATLWFTKLTKQYGVQ
jgi:hypothetical protein